MTVNDGSFLPDLDPVGQRMTLWIKHFPQRARRARHVTWHHVRHTPRYIRFIADYTTDPDQDSVVPSLILFYLLCFIDGFYNAFTAHVPTQVLEASMEHHQYRVFIWVTMIAPLLTLCGIALGYTRNWAWTGAVMRLWGDVGVAGVLTVFLTAVSYVQSWGTGNFSTTWVIASCIGSYVFSLRDMRRILDRNRWETVR